MRGPDPAASVGDATSEQNGEQNGEPGEFDWIDTDLRPLAAGFAEAFDLKDDAAAIPAKQGHELIVSKDAIVEGVHFLPDDPADLVARKLLRVNLSDLAAKGATPYAYMLAIGWPASRDRAQRRAFAGGLAADQARFGLRLLGGDTVSTPGPLWASLTIFGWAPAGAMVRRDAARPGDIVLCSGTIGDGWLGLASAKGTLDADAADRDALAERYRLPTPRLGLGVALRAANAACADISDGLIADAGHIAEASGVAIELELELAPLSGPARRWVNRQPDRLAALIGLATGGDDYELVCTAPPDAAAALQTAAEALGFGLFEIGRVMQGQGISARFEGQAVKLTRTGYRHA